MDKSCGPKSNAFVERLHRTLLNEHFRIQGRTKWYETLEEMQRFLTLIADLNQGKVRNGRIRAAT